MMNNSTVIKDIADAQEDLTIDEYITINEIVVSDVKSQTSEYTTLTDDDYDILYSNLRAWRNELVRLKQNVQMHLTNIKHKLARLQLDVAKADGETQKLKVREELIDESSKRIHSIKFLQSVELRLIDVKEFLIDEADKNKQEST